MITLNKSESMDKEKFVALMTTAAKCIIGETVIVYPRHPIHEEAAGEARLDSRGVKTINIEFSNKSDEDIFDIFLHECGHYVLGHVHEDKEFLISPELEKAFLKRGPLLKMTEEEIKAYPKEDDELQANQFARDINRYAKEYALEWYGADDIGSRLLALTKIVFIK